MYGNPLRYQRICVFVSTTSGSCWQYPACNKSKLQYRRPIAFIHIVYVFKYNTPIEDEDTGLMDGYTQKITPVGNLK